MHFIAIVESSHELGTGEGCVAMLTYIVFYDKEPAAAMVHPRQWHTPRRYIISRHAACPRHGVVDAVVVDGGVAIVRWRQNDSIPGSFATEATYLYQQQRPVLYSHRVAEDDNEHSSVRSFSDDQAIHHHTNLLLR
jgi:hypothetical protein